MQGKKHLPERNNQNKWYNSITEERLAWEEGYLKDR